MVLLVLLMLRQRKFAHFTIFKPFSHSWRWKPSVLQSCPGPRNCLKCSLNWSQTKINFKRVHHSKTSISSSCAKFKGRYIKLLFPKSLLEIQNLTKVSFPFTSSVYFKSVDLNHTCKNVWWCREGYFGQKKIAEKVRKSQQNVNRDKRA